MAAEAGGSGRAGVRVGVDVGTVRIGIAVSDPRGVLASPRTTLRRDPGGAELAALAELVRAEGAVEVVVGLPRSLSGRAGPAERAARTWAAALAAAVAPVPMRLVDERLSTVAATAGLAAAGVRGRRARARVDATAAAVILQSALDATGARADGARADGARADGGRADGGRADGGRADGARADGGRADGGRADGGRADA